jgi:hypothetical protein
MTLDSSRAFLRGLPTQEEVGALRQSGARFGATSARYGARIRDVSPLIARPDSSGCLLPSQQPIQQLIVTKSIIPRIMTYLSTICAILFKQCRDTP